MDELLTGHQAKRATERVQKKLDAIAGQQQDQDQRRLLDDIPLGTDQLADAVTALPPDHLRAMIGALMAITVQPVGKHGKAFDRKRVDVQWK